MDCTISENDQDDISEYINVYRDIHQVSNLKWSHTIAHYSQEWANQLANSNMEEKSRASFYGENIFSLSDGGEPVIYFLKNAIDNWYDEHYLYDYSTQIHDLNTIDFTCIVWRSSSQFGMGIAKNEMSNTIFIVFNTFPVGNIDGEYSYNIFKERNMMSPMFSSINQEHDNNNGDDSVKTQIVQKIHKKICTFTHIPQNCNERCSNNCQCAMKK